MLYSAEVRWFYHEPRPESILNWFCTNKSLSPEDPRMDHYLVFPGSESVGIKIREGKFEAKALRGASEIVQYPYNISGRSECWIKWSYEKEAVKTWVQAILSESHGWVDVTKVRWLRKFSLDHPELLEVSDDERPKEGCNVELTQLTIAGEEWWSFAFEAFGEPGQVREYLQKVAEHFFSIHPPILFQAINSCPYPVWLANFSQDSFKR